jgi:hypothetical protein
LRIPPFSFRREEICVRPQSKSSASSKQWIISHCLFDLNFPLDGKKGDIFLNSDCHPGYHNSGMGVSPPVFPTGYHEHFTDTVHKLVTQMEKLESALSDTRLERLED